MQNKNEISANDERTKVLIVEDSITFAGILQRSIQSKIDVEIVVCRDLSSAVECLETRRSEFFVALLDIVLPDAPNGEVVDLVVSKNIPSIVFTGEISDDLRAEMWSKRIVDYVQKVNFDDIERVISLVDRLRKNLSHHVLVVDESEESRASFKDLLQLFNFQVIEAATSKEALGLMSISEIHLAITSDKISDMTGPAFVKELRKKYTKSELPVIGCSSTEGGYVSADFLKNGTNDFINQPFGSEEFYCRVKNTLENVEYIKAIKDLSDNDYLTGVYTRSSFFKYGEKLFAQQKRSGGTLVSVMIDIDQLRQYNELYGQFVGDDVIGQIAELLRERFRKGDVLGRYTGGSFCVLCADMKSDMALDVFKEIAENISNTGIKIGENEIRTTVSIGVNTKVGTSVDEMIDAASSVLRYAKKNGPGSVLCS